MQSSPAQRPTKESITAVIASNPPSRSYSVDIPSSFSDARASLVSPAARVTLPLRLPATSWRVNGFLGTAPREKWLPSTVGPPGA